MEDALALEQPGSGKTGEEKQEVFAFFFFFFSLLHKRCACSLLESKAECVDLEWLLP